MSRAPSFPQPSAGRLVDRLIHALESIARQGPAHHFVRDAARDEYVVDGWDTVSGMESAA